MKKHSLYILFSLSLIFTAGVQTYAQQKTEGDTSILVVKKWDWSTTGIPRRVNLQIQQRSTKETMQEIQAQRVAFFTETMELTPEEAEVFWPIYNQLMTKRNRLVEGRKIIMRSCDNQRMAAMTDATADELVDKYINMQQQEAALQLEYYKKFKAILSAKKILLMYQAEDEFMQNLLRYLRSKNTPSRSTVKTEIKADTKVNE